MDCCEPTRIRTQDTRIKSLSGRRLRGALERLLVHAPHGARAWTPPRAPVVHRRGCQRGCHPEEAGQGQLPGAATQKRPSVLWHDHRFESGVDRELRRRSIKGEPDTVDVTLGDAILLERRLRTDAQEYPGGRAGKGDGRARLARDRHPEDVGPNIAGGRRHDDDVLDRYVIR